jgi:hypothetical protein
VDTPGLVWKVKVHAAGLRDKEGAQLLLAPLLGVFPRMAQVWGDDGDGGLGAWRKETLGWEREGVWVLEGQDLPPRPAGFQVLPQRWVVKGTFGWLGGAAAV